jgi:hypothetical protein
MEMGRRVGSQPTHGAKVDAPSAQTPDFGDVSEEGRKGDKIRLELVNEAFPLALMDLARLMTWAITVKGYKEGDWVRVSTGAQGYRGAMLRHDNKECSGVSHDHESKLRHATHTAWNAIARLQLLLQEDAKHDQA